MYKYVPKTDYVKSNFKSSARFKTDAKLKVCTFSLCLCVRRLDVKTMYMVKIKLFFARKKTTTHTEAFCIYIQEKSFGDMFCILVRIYTYTFTGKRTQQDTIYQEENTHLGDDNIVIKFYLKNCLAGHKQFNRFILRIYSYCSCVYLIMFCPCFWAPSISLIYTCLYIQTHNIYV